MQAVALHQRNCQEKVTLFLFEVAWVLEKGYWFWTSGRGKKK
jgi:hypothetical protein